VDELINPVTRGWDIQLVHDTFWEEDAQLILSIPVHGGMENNKAAWHFNKKGVFSVKSAYKVYRQEQINKSRRGGASASVPDPSYESIWRKIWSVQCPSKMKHFLWRVLLQQPSSTHEPEKARYGPGH